MVSNERVRKAEIRAERRMRNTDPNTDISPPLGRSFRLYTPGPEKYPGQRKRFLRHCWPGDGVPSRMATKAARNDRREARKAEREQGTTAPAAG